MAPRLRAVATLCAVQFVDVLGVTVVITALPAMLASFHADQASAGLLVTGYAVAFAGLLMLGARAGDRLGHRRVLLAGLAGFGAASLAAATAASVAVLVAARCLQGAAAAASVPAALRLLNGLGGGETARRRALAAWSASGAAAGASGFLIGGLVTQLADWRVLFWANVPLAVVLTLAVAATVPRATAGERAAGGPRDPIDGAGAVLFTTGIMGLVLGASFLERPSDRMTGAAVVAGATLLLALFARVELRAPAPLLPAAAVGDPRLRTAAGVSFLNTALTGGAVTLVTLHLQRTEHIGPGAAGLRLVPFSVGALAGAALAAPLLERLGVRAVVALGLGVIAVSDLALLITRADGWSQPAGVAASGIGIGLSSVAATAMGTRVPERLQATASGVLNTAAQLGTALGIAGLLMVASLV
jgi:MFS family permease